MDFPSEDRINQLIKDGKLITYDKDLGTIEKFMLFSCRDYSVHKFRLWACVSLVSTVYKMGIFTGDDYMKNYPQLFIALTGQAGSGKTNALRIIKHFLKMLGKKVGLQKNKKGKDVTVAHDVVRILGNLTTAEGIIKELTQEVAVHTYIKGNREYNNRVNFGYMCVSELQPIFMKSEIMSSILCAGYDNEEFKHVVSTGPEQEKLLENFGLSIIGGIIAENLAELINSNAINKGLITRLLMPYCPEKKEWEVAQYERTEAQIRYAKDFKEVLKSCLQRTGQFLYEEEALCKYKEFVEGYWKSEKDRLESSNESDLVNRRTLQLEKLALTFAGMRPNGTHTIKLYDVELAQWMLKDVHLDTLEALEAAITNPGYILANKLIRYLKTIKIKTELPEKDKLYYKVAARQSKNYNYFIDALTIALESKDVIRIKYEAGGKKRFIYCHKDNFDSIF